MKIFKFSNLCLLFVFSLAQAEEQIKNIENNDKVSVSELSSAIAPNKSVLFDTSTWVLKAEQWELTRSGESVLATPVLKTVINAWLIERHKQIEIQYPGGEEGEFWVQELVDWLVSLGIPSRQIITVPGSGADDMIKFNLIK